VSSIGHWGVGERWNDGWGKQLSLSKFIIHCIYVIPLWLGAGL